MPSSSVRRVLVVDDDPDVRRSHERIAAALGYEVESAADGIGALAMLPLGIDLVLMDGDMPNVDGFEAARRIRENPDHAHVPIIMVSGLTKPHDRRRAMEVGVNDFIGKPLDAEELALRGKWLLELKSAYDRIRESRASLAREVDAKTRALRSALTDMTNAQRLTYEAHLDTIRRLMAAAEYRDHDTAGHIERIGLYSSVVATALGMSPGEVELIGHAAPMHDVGKLGIPDRVLLKPGPLDDQEWVLMRAHTTIGAQILSGSSSAVIQLGEKIARTHHEKWDGSGYPNQIGGDDIPIEGRICAVVDFFDALTMDRPYRKAVPNDSVIELMQLASGVHFDPRILDAFLSSLDAILEIQTSHRGVPA